MRYLNFAWLTAAAISLCGCAGPAMRAPVASASEVSVTIVAQVPLPGQLPSSAARAGDSQYIVVQTQGGNIFLGPILGAMRIAQKTREMAEKNRNSVFDINPVPLAGTAFANAGLPDRGTAATYRVKPFVFVQHGSDGKFRMALVYQVESKGDEAWVGRYTYDLPTPIAEERFASLDEAGRATYRQELTQGAAALADLMKRDWAGQLPRQGRSVKVGTLWLWGERVGGMGIYTEPEELWFSAQVVGESGEFITTRINAPLGPNLAYGVHLIRRDLIHTLKPAR